MKKFWILAILIMAVLAFSACNKDNDQDDGPGPSIPPVTQNEDDPDNNDPSSPNTTNTPDNNDPGATTAPSDDNDDNNGDDDDNGDGDGTPEVIVAPRPPDVIWSLSSDEEFQNMPVGTSGDSDTVFTTAYLMGAGSPTFRVIDNPRGGVGIRIDYREQNYYAVDIVTSELGLDTSSHSYELTVHGNVTEAGNVTVGGGDTPYTTFFTQAASGDFTLTGTITEETISGAGSRGHLRVTLNNTGDLLIYEIQIKRVALVVPPPAVEVPAMPANMIYSLATDVDFQSLPVGTTGGTDEVLGTPYLQGSGSPTLTVVAGTNGNALRVSNRVNDYDSFDLFVQEMGMDLTANSYTIRIRGTVENPTAGSLAELMGLGRWGRFGVEEIGADGSFTLTVVVNAENMAENAAGNERHRIRFVIGDWGGDRDVPEAATANFTITLIEVTIN